MGLNVKSYIPASLPSIPNWNISKLIEAIKKLDRKALGLSLASVALVILTIQSLVWFRGDNAIKKINEQMPQIQVQIEKVVAKPQEKEFEATSANSKFLIDGLSVKTSVGDLPIIRKSDYLTSFRAYQTPFEYNKETKKPVIAFLIKDYGLSERVSNIATKKLPPEVSLMLSPYSDNSSKWISHAHNKGHEVWLHLPIQNKNSYDLGSNTVFHHASLNDKQNAIYKTLSQSLGYIGIASETDQTYNYAKDDYSQLFDEIYNRGLGYIELNPDAPLNIKGKAISKGAPYIKADMTIMRMSGKDSFKTLEKIAKEKGLALAIVPNNQKLLNSLATWIEKIGKIDYQIAPASALYDIPAQRNAKTSELKGEDLIDPDRYDN